MTGVRAKLHRLFGGKSISGGGVRLDTEVLSDLEQKNTGRLQAWLQQCMQDRPETVDLTQLLEEARRAGWSAAEVDKLETFALYYRGDIAEAFRHASKYAGVQDFDGDLFIIAAFSLYHLGQFEDAYRVLSSLGERECLMNGRSDFAIAAASICWAANRATEAENHIVKAWELAPDDPIVALNAYSIHFELGNMAAFDEVREAFQEGRYDLDRAGFALAVIDLAQDRYEDGFRLLESRYKMLEAHRYLNRGLFGRPRWQGETLRGKTLLVSAEQGLGDTVQLARFLPMVEALGAHVVVEVQAEAVTLLQFNFPHIEIFVREYAKAPPISFDLWVGMMSLPHLLGITAKDVPGKAGYLRVPPEAADYWRVRVTELARGRRPRIGLAWSGQPAHRADRRRSIPFARIANAIRGIDAVFFALQTHVPSVYPANLIDVSEEMVTLADTAALIAEMDLVITVDTSVVHLAGAIFKETWLLLPYRYEWRWSLEGELNNWYESVKVLRQPKTGDWESVLNSAFHHRLPAYHVNEQEVG